MPAITKPRADKELAERDKLRYLKGTLQVQRKNSVALKKSTRLIQQLLKEIVKFNYQTKPACEPSIASSPVSKCSMGLNLTDQAAQQRAEMAIRQRLMHVPQPLLIRRT